MMLTFYRPVKWAIPAIASKKDLLLLGEIQSLKPADEKKGRKLRCLVHDFHQANYLSTIGVVAGLLLAVIFFYLGFDDLIHLTKYATMQVILIFSAIAIVPFSGLVRLMGMWAVRRKFQKLKKENA